MSFARLRNRPRSRANALLFSAAIFAFAVVFAVTALARSSGDAPPVRIHRDSGEALRLQMKEAITAAEDMPYHNGETLYCSDCHTMHASMQHNYAGDQNPEGNISSFPWSIPPSKYLLKAADPVDLCLSCHDNVANVPDVAMADVNGLTERSAGHFEDPEVPNLHGHDLGRGLPTGWNLCMRCHFGPPGYAKVTCIDCHNPHGNGNPRNLQWASDPDGTPPLGLFNPNGLPGLQKYERANTSYGTLNSVALREVTNMCIDCHHVFTGESYNDANGDGIHSLHPSYDSERLDPNHITDGETRGSTFPAHWDAGVGSGFGTTPRVPFVVDGATDYASGLVVDANTNGVFCLSCHKAHGSDSPFGLVWEIDGDVERPGCDQCHAVPPLP